MVDAVETMAYANEVPWHGLGNPVSDKLTPKEIVVEAKCDWTVSKQPLFRLVGKEYVQIKDEFMLTRDSDMFPLSIVGKIWKPLQNIDAAEFFKKFVAAGKMKMETAGSLWQGRYFWCLARVTQADFELGKGSKADAVNNYMLLCSPHYKGKAIVMQYTPIRVVCWNTLNYALGSNLKGDAGAFRVPHSTEFNDTVKAQAEEALGLIADQAKEFKEAAILLSKKKASEEQVEEFFCEVLKFDPRDLEKPKKKDGEVKVPQLLPHLRNALIHAPGADLATAEGTWWGAVNAVTYVADHRFGDDRSTSLHNAWFGAKSNLKRRALEVALKRAS